MQLFGRMKEGARESMSSCPKNHDFCDGADRCLYPDGETQFEKIQRLEETIAQLKAELAAWKKPFGPQTPEEIDIFIEEAVRVEREVHEYRYKALYFRFTKVREALLIKSKAAELWKRCAKRSWKGWGYASKLHKEKHAEFVRAAKHIDQLKSECNVWLEKIADLNRRLGNLAASHDFPRAQDVAKIYELEQKLLKLQPTIKAFDELKETLRRYEGCPAEDYPNAWWRARAIIREVKSD